MSFEVGDVVVHINGERGKVVVAEMDRHGGIVVMNDDGEYDTWYAENVSSNYIQDVWLLVVEPKSMTREWGSREACKREEAALRAEGHKPLAIVSVLNNGLDFDVERLS